jgi:hypothetical protein
VAHNREDAEAFFDDKIKFAYDNLDPAIKAAVPATQDSAKSLTFAYVEPGVTKGLEVVILGERRSLTLLDAPVWDPANARQKA